MISKINAVDVTKEDIKHSIHYLDTVKKGVNTLNLEYKIFTKEEMLENVEICVDEIVKYFKENKI